MSQQQTASRKPVVKINPDASYKAAFNNAVHRLLLVAHQDIRVDDAWRLTRQECGKTAYLGTGNNLTTQFRSALTFRTFIGAKAYGRSLGFIIPD